MNLQVGRHATSARSFPRPKLFPGTSFSGGSCHVELGELDVLLTFLSS